MPRPKSTPSTVPLSYGLHGADVLISEGGGGKYLLLIATQNEAEIHSDVLPALQSARAAAERLQATG